MTHGTEDNKDLQGEGNYDATRRYDKAAHEFAESGKVEEAARAARPTSPEEADELIRAERAGKAHRVVQGIGAAPGEHYVIAGGEQCERGGTANAAARSGDHGDFHQGELLRLTG